MSTSPGTPPSPTGTLGTFETGNPKPPSSAPSAPSAAAAASAPPPRRGIRRGVAGRGLARARAPARGEREERADGHATENDSFRHGLYLRKTEIGQSEVWTFATAASSPDAGAGRARMVDETKRRTPGALRGGSTPPLCLTRAPPQGRRAAFAAGDGRQRYCTRVAGLVPRARRAKESDHLGLRVGVGASSRGRGIALRMSTKRRDRQVSDSCDLLTARCARSAKVMTTDDKKSDSRGVPDPWHGPSLPLSPPSQAIRVSRCPPLVGQLVWL